MMPPPPPDAKTDSVSYGHLTQAGLFVRVMKPDAKGRIRRTWIHRYKIKVPDGKGGFKPKDERDRLGLVQAFDSSEVATSLEEALQKVLNARAATRASRNESGGGAPRLTVAKAWEYYDLEYATHREATAEKDNGTFTRYFSHIKDRYLDELPYAFWIRFQTDLLSKRVEVGTDIIDGKAKPIYVGPVKPATMRGIINVAITLYSIAGRFEGLKNVEKDFNPPREVKKKLKAPNKKTKHIPLAKLGLAWRAAEQLCAPWWKDMFQCYVLTGLRRSLLIDMRFEQVDFARGVYLIDPHRRGTKRRGSRLDDDAPHISLPLSKHVLNILRTRQEFAPDKSGWVWYASRSPRGTRVKTEGRLSDPRSSWVFIEEVLDDLHFGPQDLRRTFATAGGVCSADLYALSLLMLHSPATVAKDVGLPSVTLDYINTAEAQIKMRAVAEQISKFVLGLAAGAAPPEGPEKPLPAYIEAALGDSESETEDELEAA